MAATAEVMGRVGLLEFDGSRGLHEVAEAFIEACRRLSEDPAVLAIVVTGRGAVFCAEDKRGDGASAVEAAAALPVPTVAAVNGPAAGTGAELALACDLRVASESASFRFPHLERGTLPRAGGSQRLPRIVGRAGALELLLLGEEIPAQAAWRRGLVGKVTPPGQALEEAMRIAMVVTEKAPVATRYLREAVHKGMDLTLEQGLRLEADLYFLLQTTADRMEGINAFLQKRRPSFTGQ